jgi:hypothetical protein
VPSRFTGSSLAKFHFSVTYEPGVQRAIARVKLLGSFLGKNTSHYLGLLFDDEVEKQISGGVLAH